MRSNSNPVGRTLTSCSSLLPETLTKNPLLVRMHSVNNINNSESLLQNTGASIKCSEQTGGLR